MPLPTPQSAGANLRTRISQSGDRYRDGVNAVTENPAEKAIAAKAKWEAGIMDAIANNRFEMGLRNVSLSDWKSATIEFGVNRYTASAPKAERNYIRFAERFFPFLETTMLRINAMPNTTFEERLEKMLANARALHEFRNT